MRRSPSGYDPYNSATSHFFIKDEIEGRNYLREIRVARAKYGDETSSRHSATLQARGEIATLMPWEDFP